MERLLTDIVGVLKEGCHVNLGSIVEFYLRLGGVSASTRVLILFAIPLAPG